MIFIKIFFVTIALVAGSKTERTLKYTASHVIGKTQATTGEVVGTIHSEITKLVESYGFETITTLGGQVHDIQSRLRMITVDADRPVRAREIAAAGVNTPRCLIPFVSALDAIESLMTELVNCLSVSGFEQVEEVRIALFQAELLVVTCQATREALTDLETLSRSSTDLRNIMSKTRNLYATNALSVTRMIPALKAAGQTSDTEKNLIQLFRIMHAHMKAGIPQDAAPAVRLEFLKRAHAIASRTAQWSAHFYGRLGALSAAVKRSPAAEWTELSDTMEKAIAELELIVNPPTTTTTTTTTAPTLSIEEIAAMFETPRKQPKNKGKKSKEKKKSEKLNPTTTTTTTVSSTTTTTPVARDGIDEDVSEWEVVGHPKGKKQQTQSQPVQVRNQAAIENDNRKRNVVSTTTTTPTTTTTTTKTTTTTTTTSTTTPEEPHEEGEPNDRNSAIEPPQNSQIPQSPYLAVPLARPTIDQIWMMTSHLGQLAYQVEVLTIQALQGTSDLAAIGNIEHFAMQTAKTRNSITDLQGVANGLIESMNTIQPFVFVPGPLEKNLS